MCRSKALRRAVIAIAAEASCDLPSDLPLLWLHFVCQSQGQVSNPYELHGDRPRLTCETGSYFAISFAIRLLN